MPDQRTERAGFQLQAVAVPTENKQFAPYCVRWVGASYEYCAAQDENGYSSRHEEERCDTTSTRSSPKGRVQAGA